MKWAVIASLLSGSFGAALISLVQFLIKRRDSKDDKTDAVIAKVGQLQREFEEDRASNARIRILRFSDEVRHGVRHSKESFDQVNLDIDAYHRYCNSHPEYKNNRAVMAIANIESVYAKCLRENDFLE